MLLLLKKIIPKSLFKKIQPTYHKTLALLGAIMYRFPSRKIHIVGVTGTKGKTTTVELVNAILEEAGFKTALAGTLRFKIGDDSKRNTYKMTMPGRFFLQQFLRKAIRAKCDWAVIEMSSEGAKQFRHKHIELDAFIFLNLAPEHIESHGGFEKYREAKKSLGEALTFSNKKDRVLVINADDAAAPFFAEIEAPNKKSFSIKDAEPYSLTETSSNFTYDKHTIHLPIPGIFNIGNALAAITFATHFGIDVSTITTALSKCRLVRGRMERVTLLPSNPLASKQHFAVIVDYAHTPDSLEKAYQTYDGLHRICILGNTGGGRDTWKRPKMGHIADVYCNEIILTNEDPYDEDPEKIIAEMQAGMKTNTPRIILDRREAINTAVTLAYAIKNNRESAQKNVIVIITGKGTDPYIMGPKGSKTPWDDATVVREELEKVLK